MLSWFIGWFQFDPLNIPSFAVPTATINDYDTETESSSSKGSTSSPKESTSSTGSAHHPRIRTKYGQRVLWLERPSSSSSSVSDSNEIVNDDNNKIGYHISEQELKPYRSIGDIPIDHILQLLHREGNPLRPGDDLLLMMENVTAAAAASSASSSSSSSSSSPPVRQEASDVDQAMAEFFETISIVPDWVDLEQLRRGQEVYIAYLPAIATSLYYRSLIAGFSIPKIAAVIRA